MYSRCICTVFLACLLDLAVPTGASSIYEEVDGLIVMEGENLVESDGRTDPQGYKWRVGTATDD